MKKLIIALFFGLLFGGEKVRVFQIDGMTCPLCTSAIKRSLKMTPGVKSAKVILNTKKATVIFDDEKTDTEKLLKAIEVVGYKGKLLKIKEVR